MERYYTFVFAFLLAFFGAPFTAFADTFVTADDMHGSVWDLAHSPYVLDDDQLQAPAGGLTIEPGVTVEASVAGQGSLFLNAGSNIRGTADQPITFQNIGSLRLVGVALAISQVRFVDAPLDVRNATVTMDHVSSVSADTAFTFFDSRVSATDVSIASSSIGIDSAFSRPVLIGQRNHFLSWLADMFQFPKALAQTAIADPSQNQITIASSTFDDTDYAIYNATQNTVNAPNDWWGSDSGPGATSNKVYGPVSYDPWQGKAIASSCCSSVIFFPGIESSRLAIDTHPFLGTTTSQLWEPVSNARAAELDLDSRGASVHGNIHPTTVIDTAFGLWPLYQKFISTMNGMVGSRLITEWQPYPYDWRLSLADAARGSIGTSTLVQAVERMASTSKTGKVTFVAHSNGGLVAKLVYNALRDKGEAGLIDSIIFVAVPQLGTPQALASFLHGDGEEIAHGLLLSAETARNLALNMPSAYSLLPGQSYFNLVPGTMISFASSTLGGMRFQTYAKGVTAYSQMKSFVDDLTHGASTDPLNVPMRGNASLFAQSESVHSVLNSWKPASGTRLVAIAGWGIPTMTALHYFQKVVCTAANALNIGAKTCSPTLEYADLMDGQGDGTVFIPSALYSSSTDFVFDEGRYDRDTGQSLSHGDILQADPVMTVIADSIEHATSTDPYMTPTVPTDIAGRELTIGIHSPATLNVYDSSGRHTGPIPNPIPGSDLDAYENAIPGSAYREEGDQVYAVLPDDSGYRVSIDGTGIGSVEVTTDVSDAGTGAEIASATFADIPVTPLTHMEFAPATSSDPRSAYAAILVDEDGDGSFDATSTPGSEPDITSDSYWNAIGGCIRALKLPTASERAFLNRLTHAKALLQRGDAGTLKKVTDDLNGRRIGHARISHMADADRRDLQGLVEALLDDAGV